MNNKKLSPKSRKELEAAGIYVEKNYIKPVSHQVVIDAVTKSEKLENEIEKLNKELELEEQYALSMPVQHLEFCDNFVNGDLGVAGDARQSYIRAFGKTITKKAAAGFLRKKHIAAKVKELYEEKQNINFAKRIYVEEKLLGIAEECAKARYKDRYGHWQSPAAMRSVAVTALRTINEMNGFNQPVEIKDVSEKKTGINFNLIVPDSKKDE